MPSQAQSHICPRLVFPGAHLLQWQEHRGAPARSNVYVELALESRRPQQEDRQESRQALPVVSQRCIISVHYPGCLCGQPTEVGLGGQLRGKLRQVRSGRRALQAASASAVALDFLACIHQLKLLTIRRDGGAVAAEIVPYGVPSPRADLGGGGWEASCAQAPALQTSATGKTGGWGLMGSGTCPELIQRLLERRPPAGAAAKYLKQNGAQPVLYYTATRGSSSIQSKLQRQMFTTGKDRSPWCSHQKCMISLVSPQKSTNLQPE